MMEECGLAETLAGSCEHGDEHTGFTKGGKTFD